MVDLTFDIVDYLCDFLLILGSKIHTDMMRKKVQYECPKTILFLV
jgi:hypothetical protein